MAGKTVNKAELAAIFGVSLTAIENWLANGLPYVEKGGPGTSYKFDSAQVIEWRVDQAVEKAADSAAKGKGEPLTRKITAEAALAELKLDRELGRLVAIEDVEKTWDKLSTACRARLLAIPARIGPVAFAAESVDDVRDLIEESIHLALNELASKGIEASPTGDGGTDSTSEPPVRTDEATAEADGEPVGGRETKAKSGSKRRARPVGHSKG